VPVAILLKKNQRQNRGLGDRLESRSQCLSSGPGALTVSGGNLANNYLLTREELMRRANDVIAGVQVGWLKLNIGRVMPLEQAGQAHKLLESRKKPLLGPFL